MKTNANRVGERLPMYEAISAERGLPAEWLQMWKDLCNQYRKHYGRRAIFPLPPHAYDYGGGRLRETPTMPTLPWSQTDPVDPDDLLETQLTICYEHKLDPSHPLWPATT